MTKQNLTVVLVLAALVGVITLVIATSMFGGSMSHNMPDGQMMNGETMQSRPGSSSHQMSDGQSMDDAQMQTDK